MSGTIRHGYDGWKRSSRLNHIQLAVPHPRGTAAFRAEAVDFQPVAGHDETVLGGDVIERAGERSVLEFDQLAAFLADQMIVLRADAETDSEDKLSLEIADLP